MRAGGSVHAGISQAKTRHRNAAYQMRLDDLVHISGSHKAVPDRFRVDDDRRAMLALIQASRFVDADAAFQSGIFGCGLKQRQNLAFAVLGAASPGVAGIADIGADEDMVLKIWQIRFLFSGSSLSV